MGLAKLHCGATPPSVMVLFFFKSLDGWNSPAKHWVEQVWAQLTPHHSKGEENKVIRRLSKKKYRITWALFQQHAPFEISGVLQKGNYFWKKDFFLYIGLGWESSTK